MGLKVSVRVALFPGETFNGTVTYLSDQSELTMHDVQTIKSRRATEFAMKHLVLNPDLKL